MQSRQKREIINTTDAPPAVGPYAQAVRCGDFLFVSGILPIDPKTGEMITGDPDREFRLVFESMKAIIEAGGMSLHNVVKTSIFMKDLEDFPRFNAIYGEYFQDILPARETVQVQRLPRGASIEISAICGI